MPSILLRKPRLYPPNRWRRITSGEIAEMDPERDRLLLVWLARHGLNASAAQQRLGVSGTPPFPREYSWSGYIDEDYWMVEEQVLREEDVDVLKQAALADVHPVSTFAFCRLTGFRYPASDEDQLSYCTYYVNRIPGMTDEAVRALCRELIENEVFVSEATSLLEDEWFVGDDGNWYRRPKAKK